MKTPRPEIRLVDAPAVTADADHRVQLVRKAQRGDVSAFEQLARDHYQQLFAFAMGFADGPADASDITQDALVKAYRKIGSYRFASSFSTWLLQIARNSYLDRARQRQQHRTKLQRYANLAPASHPATPEQALADKQRRQSILRALHRVDPKFREVVVLFDLEGLNYKEIATVCSIPMGTVKSRLRRGRDALCKALIQDGAVVPGRNKRAEPASGRRS